MVGHSRSKNGVASLAYVPAIHVFARPLSKTWMPATGAGMTLQSSSPTGLTRWSMLPRRLRMDCRIKSGNDEAFMSRLALRPLTLSVPD
jgi:hypothetical protein